MNRKALVRTLVPPVALALTAAAAAAAAVQEQSAVQAVDDHDEPGPGRRWRPRRAPRRCAPDSPVLLTEHVDLASMATNAAIHGDTKVSMPTPRPSTARPTATPPTSSPRSRRRTAGTGTAFDGLWRSEKHIPQFVAYAQAAAKGDEAGKQAAVAELTGYATAFGDTLHQVNENLPADAVTQDLVMHATTLIKVIDAQEAGDAAGCVQGVERRVHPHGRNGEGPRGCDRRQVPPEVRR